MSQLANGISLLGILCALAASYFLGDSIYALVLYNIALICDLFDGYVARTLHTTSTLGVWLDTVDDILLYLLFPAIIIYNSAPTLVVALPLISIIISGLWRLVRFARNGLETGDDSLFYTGVPVYFILPMVFFTPIINELWGIVAFWLLSLLLCALMVSTLPIKKWKPPFMLALLVVYNIFLYVFIF